MFDLVKFAVQTTKTAVADRKGVTALEYALIAAAVVTLVMVGYKTLFTNLKGYVSGIAFG